MKTYIAAGVDGVVITDHNSGEGIEMARAALAELRDADPATPDFVLFPGVEMTVAGGVHVLGIFDPKASARTVDDVIAKCNYLGLRGASTQTANVTVVDAARCIAEGGGLCVPAHADKNAGIFTRSELDLPTLQGGDIRAVEVIEDSEVDKAQRLGWVPLLGSDAHFLTTDGCPPGEEAKAPGTHFTWVKAESLDLEGLKLALTDPKESIRRGRREDTDPNLILHAHLNSITVRNRGAVKTFSFNPWMNCLIGGRGVGKSTVLELLRLSMGRSGDLRELPLWSDMQRFIPDGDSTQNWWDADSSLEVRYTKDAQTLRVLWSGDKPEISRVEAWTGTAWEAQAGSAADRAPIQVFSQKQIYELSRDPQSFLSILDRMEEIRKAEWDEEYAALESAVRKSREGLRELLAETDKSERLRGQLQEVQARLRHLDALRADPRFQELERLEATLRSTQDSEDRAQVVVDQLKASAESLSQLLDGGTDLPSYGARAASFARAKELVEEAVAGLTVSAGDWRGGGEAASWTARVEELNSWLSGEDSSGAHLSAEQTHADRARERALQEELLRFDRTGERLLAKQAQIKELLDLLAAKRRELHRRRSEYVKKLSSANNARTRVAVFHQGGIDGVGGELRRVMNRLESFDSVFEPDGLPKPLFDAQRKHPDFSVKVVPAFKAELRELVQQGADSSVAERVRIDGRFHRRSTDSDAFDLETNVLLWFPEDLVAVDYKPEGSHNFTPVDQGSPGQKTAALLAIILQMGTEPLLLDQPEDDLENKLIKHLAVETLKQIKRTRQLIISTHNANIVVTSAAEQVIVIEHGEHVPGIEAVGTLQSKPVRDNVCLILEGGEDAIRTRYRRLLG